MASNQTVVVGNSGSNNNNDTQVAVVALVVSVVALVGTLLQVGQQYLASAAGYSSCDESVIGPWHKTKKRQFRYSEMRFRVLFKSPVFFVCPADNTKGPVRGAPVYFVQGTDSSVKKTLSLPVEDPPAPPKPEAPSTMTQSAIVTGLEAIATKTMEVIKRRPWLSGRQHGRDAKDRHELAVEKQNKHAQDESEMDAASEIPTASTDHKGVHTVDSEMATWVRLLQEMHRMEMYSRLWENSQVANNPKDSLQVADFQTHKLCVAIQGKQLSWDTMPASINRPYATTTISHMVEMAAMLGIYWKEFDKTTRHYRAEGNGYVLSGSRIADFGGIFFAFQICGKNRFEENRIIPADEAKEFAFGLVPTIFREKGDIRRLAFSVDDIHNLGTLLLGSPSQFGETLASIGCNTYSSNCLQDEATRHGHLFPLAFEVMGMVGKKLHRKGSAFRFLPNPTYRHWDKKFFSMNLLLKAYNSQIQRLGNEGTRIPWLKAAAAEINELIAWDADECTFDYGLMALLNRKIRVCDEFLRAKGRNNVGLVLRQHIQQVLYMVNSKDRFQSGDDGQARSSAAPKTTSRYDELMAATPGERQALLMEIYFTDLKDVVVQKAVSAHNSMAAPSQKAPDKAAIVDTKSWADFHEPLTPEDNVFTRPATSLEAEAVWCTLVFRMLCWLALHDFNKADVQFERDELLGSRLPVFIR
ncbi:modin [Ophiostoma piceae UAMH 11346]|uniref:Modin n=1 Tax=Ophiostoma piceae (strain UAMH 11346) TaxID=1262450 RepID=S3BU84_OPHP1|nr:modin [Ophiostoma piceae UAMH 11346]